MAAHRAGLTRSFAVHDWPLAPAEKRIPVDHRGSSGLRHIVNPPDSAARVHQHLDIGQGEVDWDLFFATLAEVGFHGIATVCVFAWEERADVCASPITTTTSGHACDGPSCHLFFTPRIVRMLCCRATIKSRTRTRWSRTSCGSSLAHSHARVNKSS
jgi:hypothetical protein